MKGTDDLAEQVRLMRPGSIPKPNEAGSVPRATYPADNEVVGQYADIIGSWNAWKIQKLTPSKSLTQVYTRSHTINKMKKKIFSLQLEEKRFYS